jgi:hypothetical protein
MACRDQAVVGHGEVEGSAKESTQRSSAEVTAQKRLYVVVLERGVARKRFFFEGEDTDEAYQQFQTVRAKLPDLASSSSDWSDFLKAATIQFAQRGFLHTAH